MQKITFEDTTVTKQPYVTINDIEYEVTDGTYSGGTDLNANTFNTMQDNIEEAIEENKNVQLIAISDTAPTTFTTGDKYYNTSTNKVYTALNNSTWNNGETPLSDIFYILFSEQSSYSYDGNTLVSVGGGTEDIIISEEEPQTDDWKIWIDSGAVSSQASEIHIGKNAPTNSMQRTWFKIGKNLFDKDNANVINAYPNGDENVFISTGGVKTIYIPILGGYTYTISRTNGIRFRACTTETVPNTGVSISNFIANDSGTSITITANSNAKYLCCFCYNSTLESRTLEQALSEIQIELGTFATTYEAYINPSIIVDDEEIYSKIDYNIDLSSYKSSNVSTIARAKVHRTGNLYSFNCSVLVTSSGTSKQIFTGTPIKPSETTSLMCINGNLQISRAMVDTSGNINIENAQTANVYYHLIGTIYVDS